MADQTYPCPECGDPCELMEGEHPKYDRRTFSIYCEGCDEHFEVSAADVDAARTEQQGPPCPNCGKRCGFDERHAHVTEKHGFTQGPYEEFDETWLECRGCHQPTTDAEVHA
jgi:hypothetical protein